MVLLGELLTRFVGRAAMQVHLEFFSEILGVMSFCGWRAASFPQCLIFYLIAFSLPSHNILTEGGEALSKHRTCADLGIRAVN